MKTNLNILFLITLILGTIISISSSNWLGVWMGLELNMLSFIPLLTFNKNILSSEASLKYFLIQSVASIIFISAALLTMLFFTLFNNFNFFLFTNFMMNTALLLKLGAAPFQTWFISIMNGISWFNCFILMTWQKITPLCIMLYLIFNHKFIFIFSILSLLVGSIGGLNQTYIKKILAFSSVNHLGWMFISLILSKYLFLVYFSIYLFMNLLIIWIAYIKNFCLISSTFLINKSWLFLINLLSLGGLPPFLGFAPKMMIIQNFIASKNFLLILVMVFTSLITLFYYLRMIYASILFNFFTQKNFFTFSHSFPLSLSCMNMATIFGLFIWNLL